MSEAKDILNDVYLVYKKWKESGDLGTWNKDMGKLSLKYPDDCFYENLVISFGERIAHELNI